MVHRWDVWDSSVAGGGRGISAGGPVPEPEPPDCAASVPARACGGVRDGEIGPAAATFFLSARRGRFHHRAPSRPR